MASPEFPQPEQFLPPVTPEFFPENSPEFKAAYLEMKAQKPDMPEDHLKHLVHMKFVEKGMEIDKDRRKEDTDKRMELFKRKLGLSDSPENQN